MKLHLLAAALVALGLAGAPAQAAPDAQQPAAKTAKKIVKKPTVKKKNTASSPAAASRDDDEWSTFLRDDDGDPNIEVDFDCGYARGTRKGEKRKPCFSR